MSGVLEDVVAIIIYNNEEHSISDIDGEIGKDDHYLMDHWFYGDYHSEYLRDIGLDGLHVSHDGYRIRLGGEGRRNGGSFDFDDWVKFHKLESLLKDAPESISVEVDGDGDAKLRELNDFPQYLDEVTSDLESELESYVDYFVDILNDHISKVANEIDGNYDADCDYERTLGAARERDCVEFVKREAVPYDEDEHDSLSDAVLAHTGLGDDDVIVVLDEGETEEGFWSEYGKYRKTMDDKREAPKDHQELFSFFAVAEKFGGVDWRIKSMKEALENGADINKPDIFGLTALSRAVLENNVEIVDFLIENGADVNAICDEPAVTAVAWTGNMDLLDKLLSHGADVSVINMNGENALHNAIAANKVDMIDKLLSLGVDINNANKMGNTPLARAIYADNEALINELLDRGANPQSAVRYQMRMFGQSIFSVDKYWKEVDEDESSDDVPNEVCDKMIAAWGDDNDNLLYYALSVCESYKTDIAIARLSKDSVDNECPNDRAPLWIAVRDCESRDVRALLESGADPNKAAPRHGSYLHFAIKSSDEETLKILAEYGADFKMKNESGLTPLEYAASLYRQHQIVTLVESLSLRGVRKTTEKRQSTELGL